jgi:hypothetical protein
MAEEGKRNRMSHVYKGFTIDTSAVDLPTGTVLDKMRGFYPGAKIVTPEQRVVPYTWEDERFETQQAAHDFAMKQARRLIDDGDVGR